MTLLSLRLRTLCILALLLVPFSAYATNGYFLIGYGAKSRSMGGVGVAYAQDGLAAAANPAGMADAGVSTMRIDFGGEFFNPPRSVVHSSTELGTHDSPIPYVTDEKSGSNEFLIPSFGAIYKFNRKLYLGMAVIGNGANTRYHQTVPGNPTCVNGDTSGGTGSYFFNFNCNADSTTVGVQLLQMQMLPSVAFVVNKHNTVGASLAIGVQTFRAYGIGAFQDLGFASSKKNVSGEGNDWSYGAGVRLGWLGKFFDDRLSLGVNYSSRVFMSKFEKYKNLFAEHGDFDIPENYTIGLAYKVTPKLTVAADIERINYSDIASVAHPGPNASNPGDFNPYGPCGVTPSNPNGDDDAVPGCKLGGDYGMGFGWRDSTAYKIGFNYDYNSSWSFRAGFNHGATTIQKDQVLFNMLAPATVEDHVTVGASYRPSKNIEWSFNAMHGFENTISGPTAFSNFPPGVDNGPPVDNASISMEINTFGISFGYSL
jgi:long-chain fatty acid transport protein